MVSCLDIKLDEVYLAKDAAAILRGYGYKAESGEALYPEILKILAIEEFQNNLIM